ncbi:hypothetical protein V6N13_119846 [Hibiscus sabdariffa]
MKGMYLAWWVESVQGGRRGMALSLALGGSLCLWFAKLAKISLFGNQRVGKLASLFAAHGNDNNQPVLCSL